MARGKGAQSIATVTVILLFNFVTSELCSRLPETPLQATLCNYLPPTTSSPVTAQNATSLCLERECQCSYCPCCTGATEAACLCAALGSYSMSPFRAVGASVANQSSTFKVNGCTFYAVCPDKLSYNYTGCTCAAAPQVQLTGIMPSSGPAYGGTLITITGSGLDALTNVWMGISACDLSPYRPWQNSTTAYCQTSASNNTAVAGKVNYTVAGSSVVSGTQLTFTYFQNPTVTSISRLTSTYSGLKFSFAGIDLNKTALSYIVSASNDDPSVMYFSACLSSTGSTLICRMPALNTSAEDNATYSYAVFLYMDGFVNVSGINNTEGNWSLPFKVNPEPVVNSFRSVGLLYIYDPPQGGEQGMLISGTGLDSVSASDYYIEIGKGSQCTVVMVFYNNLTCVPPESVQDLGTNFTTYVGQNAAGMVVKIPETGYEMFVGYIMLYDRTNAHIIMGVVFGALGLAAILIAVSVTIYVRRELAQKRRKADVYQTKESLSASDNSHL